MVYLATDPDREGEAIAWHLQQALDLPDDRVRRVTFHEITERAVKEAFSHVGPINMDMVNAQQARRFLDRFVGYQLSPLLWKKVARNLSAGPGPVGRRPPDRRPRAGDPGVRLRGILEDHRDRQPGRLDRRGRPVRGRAWPSATGPSSRPRTRPTPTPIRDALAVGRLRRRQGRRGREARQGRRPVQDQHAPAAGRDPAAVLGQEDDEGRPGALRRDRRRRHRARSA